MEYKSANEIRNAITKNINIIRDLFSSAKRMQDSISELQDDKDKELMTQNFNAVVESINSLVKSTNNLFDLLEQLMEE